MRRHDDSLASVRTSATGRFITPQGEVWRHPSASSRHLTMRSAAARFKCPAWPYGMTPDAGISIERDDEPWGRVGTHARTHLPPRWDLSLVSFDGRVEWIIRTRRFVDEIRRVDTEEVVYSARRIGLRSMHELRHDLSLEEATLALLLAHASVFALTSRWPSI